MSAILQQKFTDLQNDQTEDRVIIIGGGIVGLSLAYHLSKRNCDSQIILLDSSLDDPHNSTAFAPGLVGQLNTITHLTEMAKETVSEYSKITGGFQQVGGLEIASTEAGIAQLHSRHSLARTAGLPSQILNSVEASQLAPDFAINDEGSKGLFFPLDGIADSKLISKYYLSEAKSQGVILLSLKVTSISQPALAKYPAGYNLEVSTELGFLGTKKLIVATGIWTSELVKTLGIDLPIVPVLHPYAHGPERSARGIQQPFVRWPERHIYARDHGNSDGWGSYDHEPIRYAPANSALLNSSVQSVVIDSALSVFPNGADSESKSPYRAFHAAFSVTPDNLPLAGAVPQVPGLFLAAAIWITQAAGVARLVADIISEKLLLERDVELKDAFNPMRFEGQDQEGLNVRALATYNNIYNKNNHP